MKLIKTKDYLLLVDKSAEEIKVGDYFYNESNSEIDISNYVIIPTKWDATYRMVAYYPLTEEAKELDLPLLPNPFEEDDIEVLADNYVNNQFSNYYFKSALREVFKDGYKIAQTKQYSLEDMKKAIKYGMYEAEHKSDKEINSYIQSLSIQQPPKQFIPKYIEYSFDEFTELPECETYLKIVNEYYRYSDGNEDIEQWFYAHIVWISSLLNKGLKTVLNCQNKLELVGTYKY